jgi:hypothetical protein
MTHAGRFAPLHMLKKRQVDVMAHLKEVLDRLTADLSQDPFPLCWASQRVPSETEGLPQLESYR